MSYNEYETSTQKGLPVELYLFTQGLVNWCYTTSMKNEVYNFNTYVPSAIKRDSIKQTGNVFKDALKFTFPRENSFAVQFLGFTPDLPTTVTVYRKHLDDPASEYIVEWKGRVVGSKTEGNSIEIECESVFTSIKRPGLRARYEYGCRHTLYQKGCYLNRDLYEVSGAVNSISNGIVIGMAILDTYPDGYFTGGMIIAPDDSYRFIVDHVGPNITLSRPTGNVVVGSIISAYPGCNHTKETCLTKFNNINNFGGFPWIPRLNPFGGSSVV